MTWSVPPTPLPLPPPPWKGEKQTTLGEDRRGANSKNMEDKWSTLRAYQRARGLCIKCAEKWSKDPHCADSVQLNTVQENIELF